MRNLSERTRQLRTKKSPLISQPEDLGNLHRRNFSGSFMLLVTVQIVGGQQEVETA